jgi:hypothetical protein
MGGNSPNRHVKIGGVIAVTKLAALLACLAFDLRGFLWPFSARG